MMDMQIHALPVENVKYDCVECGRKNCISVKDNQGYCETPGCLSADQIQFVFYPHWSKPKASRAGREIWLLK